jgi:hypothetical protein
MTSPISFYHNSWEVFIMLKAPLMKQELQQNFTHLQDINGRRFNLKNPQQLPVSLSRLQHHQPLALVAQ